MTGLEFVLRSSPARVRRWAASRSAQWPGLGTRPGTIRSDPARSSPIRPGPAPQARVILEDR
jgi:hypothetical protein